MGIAALNKRGKENMSDSKKDRRDKKDMRDRDYNRGRTKSRYNQNEDEEFDWHKYTGNVKDIKLDEDFDESDNG